MLIALNVVGSFVLVLLLIINHDWYLFLGGGCPSAIYSCLDEPDSRLQAVGSFNPEIDACARIRQQLLCLDARLVQHASAVIKMELQRLYLDTSINQEGNACFCPVNRRDSRFVSDATA